jgi:hypothetical protein
MFCSNCGFKLSDEWKFCPTCGTSRTAASAAQTHCRRLGARGNPRPTLVPTPLSSPYSKLSSIAPKSSRRCYRIRYNPTEPVSETDTELWRLYGIRLPVLCYVREIDDNRQHGATRYSQMAGRHELFENR